MTCDVCDKPVRSTNKYGVCTREPECKRERNRREYADPEMRAHKRRYREEHLEAERARARRNQAKPAARAQKAQYRAAKKDAFRVYHNNWRGTVRGQSSTLLAGAHQRAGKHGLPFDLTLEWVVSELEKAIRDGCPYLGIPIILGGGKNNPNAPSIEQFIPRGGYTQTNCTIVSYRANIIKNDASPEELNRLTRNVNLLARTRFSSVSSSHHIWRG